MPQRNAYRSFSHVRATALTTVLSLGGFGALALPATDAAAACLPNPTAGNDTVECHDANGALDLLGGDDTLTVNTGADVTGNVTGNTGNDTMTVNDGSITGNFGGGDGNDAITINGGTITGAVRGENDDDLIIINGGTITGSVNAGPGNDRVFMYGGTVGGEFQNGTGTDYTFLFGGTIEGTIEMQRGAVNSVIVVDGVTALAGFEMQNPNASLPLAENPTFYLRSGFVGIGRWGNANDSHFIIDPINSIDPASLDPNAADIAAAFAAAAANPNEDHLLVIGEGAGDDDDDDDGGDAATIAFGNGNDRLDFIGAVNRGDGQHNLHFGEIGEDEEEIPVFDGDGQPPPPMSNPPGLPGTPGTLDTLTVSGGSNLVLGGVINFEVLAVLDGSILELTDDDYDFGAADDDAVCGDSGTVCVDHTSELILSNGDTELEAGHVELQGALDGDPATFEVARYYDAFAPGGVLTFARAQDQAAGGDDDDDDDDIVLDDDDDDDDDSPAFGPSHVTVTTGDDTFLNDGTLNGLNDFAGDLLTINGGYESVSGKLAIDAFVQNALSAADRLELDGPIEGTTTIYVNNLNAAGPGEFTGQEEGDGLLVVSGEGFEPDSFQLGIDNRTGEREVISGAFSYRLAVTEDAARLQSDLLAQVPAYVAAPSVALRHALAGSDTVYKRLGELAQEATADGGRHDGAWLRGKFSDYDVAAASGFGFSKTTQSVIGGYDIALPLGTGFGNLGAFAGYGVTHATVDAVLWGLPSTANVSVKGLAIGAYGSWRQTDIPGVGLYVDGVARYDHLNFNMGALASPATASTGGEAISLSGETGYGIALAPGMTLQPQAQLIYTTVLQDAYTDSIGVVVAPGISESLVGRLGIQLEGTFAAGGGSVSPYLIANVMSEFLGSSTTTVGGTEFVNDLHGTWFNIGGGVSANLNNQVKLYASGEYNFGAIAGWGATAGVKVNW